MARQLLPVWLSLGVALIGSIIGVGGLASLQANTPAQINDVAHPYEYLWFLGCFELFSIGYGFWATRAGFARLRSSVITFLALAIATIQPLLADFFYKTAEFPGSGGSPTRGNVTIGGLLTAVIGNYLAILASAYHSLTTTSHLSRGASEGSLGPKPLGP